MTYRVEIRRSAQKEMLSLPNKVTRRVDERIRSLAEAPRPRGSKKLEKGIGYRLRVGDYRIIYQIDDSEGLVLITGVRHRREAYR